MHRRHSKRGYQKLIPIVMKNELPIKTSKLVILVSDDKHHFRSQFTRNVEFFGSLHAIKSWCLVLLIKQITGSNDNTLTIGKVENMNTKKYGLILQQFR